jgi:hypothetical protein
VKIIQFADEFGRPAQVRTDSILAVLKNGAFVRNDAHHQGGYNPAVLLLEGGHRVETNTDYDTIVKTWVTYHHR